MSINDGFFEAPLSIGEVSNLFGCDSDLISVCKSEKINKWAIYKPVRVSGIDSPTLEQRKSINMGLSLVQLAKLKATDYHSASTTKYSLSECLAEIYECGYTKPNGGTASPYRLGDFLDIEGTGTMQGYDHNAVATDSDWKDANASESEMANGTTLFANFSARINEQTASYIGSANYHFLPLTYIADFSYDWYLAYAVYVPSTQRFHFAVSKTTLNEITDSSKSQNALIDFSTNGYLRYLVSNNPTDEINSYTTIPCLLRVTKGVSLSTQVMTYTSISVTNAIVYAMPSGCKSFAININVPLSNSGGKLSGTYYMRLTSSSKRKLDYIYKDSSILSHGLTKQGWFITSIMTSQVNGFDYNVVFIAFLTREGNSDTFENSDSPLSTQNTSLKGTLTYEYLTIDGTSAVSHTDTKTYTGTALSASTRVTIGGYTFYGYKLVEGIGAKLKSFGN